MQISQRLKVVLQTGGFSIHHHVGRLLKIGFLAQCLVISGLAALVVLIGGIVDHTLILPGRDIGLLEHPGIWVFFGLQIALPISIRRSLKKLITTRIRIREIAKSKSGITDLIVTPLLKFLRLEDAESRLTATVLYCAGLVAFVWNTYQNQRPGIVLPYDFWDSKNHFWGFWITRVYKLYLFGWLLPYIGLVHIGIVVVILRLIRRGRLSGSLKLIPFHPDGAGGLGFVPSLVTTPIIVTLLFGSISTAAAFEVHRAPDVTPIMGLIVLIGSACSAYILPILFLRTDVVAMKTELISKLRMLQQAYYSAIIVRENLDFDALKKGNEALDYFEKVCAKVQAISNYPHFRRLFKYVGLALTPSVISLALNLFQRLEAMIGPVSRKP